MADLLIATHNRGKLVEYRQLLAGLRARLLYLLDVGISAEPAESGETYAENARIKALYYARLSGLLTLADDSGLEVDALGGEPGVRSARYAGPAASDRQRYELLLSRLKDVPREQRTARFRCAVAVARPDGQVWTVEGACEGLIGYEPRGEHGFGYDPVFIFPELGATMAELAPEVKNRVSHRARAAERALPLLQALLRGETPLE
jgi:XTP/dITP diphosphohydrolase